MLGWTVSSPRCRASIWSTLIPPFSSAPFCKRRAGEDVARLAGMDADARGVLVEQAVDDVDLRLAAAPAAPGTGPAPSSAPEPLAHQWSGLTPQPMNSAANRFGGGRRAAGRRRPRRRSDSSQGSAIVTPAPRRKARRVAPRRSWSRSCPVRGASDIAITPPCRLRSACSGTAGS